MVDIAKARAQTPSCHHLAHFNNAGASLPAQPVLEAVQAYWQLEAKLGGYEAERHAHAQLQTYYTTAARLLHCDARNIAWAVSATEGYAKAVSAIPLQAGDVVVTTESDYVSNQILYYSLHQRTGVKMVRCPSLASGEVDLDALRVLFERHKPKLFSLSHMPTSSGLIHPAEAAGKLCAEFDVYYLLDACQTFGQLNLDVKKLQCDFLSATGRKFMRGPRGTGVLFVSDKVLQRGLAPLYLDMAGANWVGTDAFEVGTTAKKFECWENAYALQCGLTAAMQHALNWGMDNVQQAIMANAEAMRKKLKSLRFLQVNEVGVNQGAIISTTVPGWNDAAAIRHFLQQKNINVSIQSMQDARLDFNRLGIAWSVRISPHYYNTAQEMDALIDALREWHSTIK